MMVRRPPPARVIGSGIAGKDRIATGVTDNSLVDDGRSPLPSGCRLSMEEPIGRLEGA